MNETASRAWCCGRRWSSRAIPATGTVRRLHEAAHELCFIANSVNFPVVVE